MNHPDRNMNKCENCNRIINELNSNNAILNIIYSLPKRYYVILVMRLYLQKSFTECAKLYSVSTERIRQLETKTIKKIINRAMYTLNIRLTCEDIRNTLIQNENSLPGLKTKTETITTKFLDMNNIELPIHITPVQQPSLQDGLDKLDLSIKVNNLLRNAGIITIETLIKYNREDLLSIKGFGVKCFREVRDELDRLRIIHNMSTTL